MKTDTFNCKADIYWRIVERGKAAIPFLINKLTDTAKTSIKHPCKKETLNAGEVAHFVLTQIADFPTYLVTKIQFDVFSQGCWSFYEYLFNNAAKTHYQKSVRDWYDKEKKHYKAKKISKKNQTECQKLFGIDTFYRWRE